MTTSFIISTIATVKFVQFCMLGMVATRTGRIFKIGKEAKTWSVTQFLEESRLEKR
jgi:hypothetical protein